MSEADNEKTAARFVRHENYQAYLNGEATKESAPPDARDDVEAQKPDFQDGRLHVSSTAAEYLVATKTKLFYLAVYFALNLALTIYNKAVLGGVCSTPHSN